MSLEQLNILFADDDPDDRLFFKEALGRSFLSMRFTTVTDGEQLMNLLNTTHGLPDVLFLDLNMPRKNGFECLEEIKQSSKLKALPVVVFSTSFEQEKINLLYKNGAQYYIHKPSEFSQFKEIILQVIRIIEQGNTAQPAIENFVIKLQGV